MLLDKKKKKIAKHSSFLPPFFFLKYPWNSFLPRRSFSSVNYSTFAESLIHVE